MHFLPGAGLENLRSEPQGWGLAGVTCIVSICGCGHWCLMDSPWTVLRGLDCSTAWGPLQELHLPDYTSLAVSGRKAEFP